jgi:1-acyl-sn-glycerol-3-phosphate acyltransferase
MTISTLFDDIRPYNKNEIPGAMYRIAHHTSFPLLASYVFPDRDIEEVRRQVENFKTVEDFQLGVMYHVNEKIIEKTITEFSYGGIENLASRRNHLFVSNHRDIMLDASLMQNVLSDNGFDTCEITFGSNLMQNQLVVDLGKSNKMFKVERPGESFRDFYKSSMHLSYYIRNAIVDRQQSVWIAQRNGRTKNGIDRTDQGIVKMFCMSRQDNKVASLSELSILPVAVSYEWESCDILKAIELYERLKGPYIKKPGEDLNSIITGITQPKGRVHIEFCDPVTKQDLLQFDDCTANEYHKLVAHLIDSRICTAYRLFPNNFIAHDLRYGNSQFKGKYTEDEKQAFLAYMNKLYYYEEECDIEKLKDLFLGIYAGPVDSAMLFDGEL